MTVLVRSEVSTVGVLERPVASSHERRIEVGVLLRAVTALHRDGMLTEAEYETKRRRLAAQL